jgi:hypothetical protein
MSDFTDSLRGEDDTELKTFVLELFDRVNDLHSSATSEFAKAYHQGEKDSLRRVLAIMTGRDVDTIIPSSVVSNKLRGVIPLDNGEFIKQEKS